MEKIEALYDLCDTISKEIEKANAKIQKSGGSISASDLDVVDKLTHSLKSIKTAIAMMESEGSYESGAHSGSYRGSYDGGSYRGSYDGGMSYARGRGRGAKRDSMGRYSSERGYSRDADMEDLIGDLRSMMDRWPDDTRNAADNLLSKLER